MACRPDRVEQAQDETRYSKTGLGQDRVEQAQDKTTYITLNLLHKYSDLYQYLCCGDNTMWL